MKRKYIIFCLAVVIIILAAAIFAHNVLAAEIDIRDSGQIKEFIEEKLKVENTEICCIQKSGAICAVTYHILNDEENESCGLFVFEKNSRPFSDNYVYKGEAHSSKQIDTYNFNQSGEYSIVIVYGNTDDTGITNYSFENCGRTYAAPINTSHFLDIYYLVGSPDASSYLVLYDANGEEVKQ